ncbi:Septin spn4, partial [Coemansia sp. RSA 485]
MTRAPQQAAARIRWRVRMSALHAVFALLFFAMLCFCVVTKGRLRPACSASHNNKLHNTCFCIVLTTASARLCLCLCSSLKPLDVRAMKAIGARVNLIPVIAKADTLSPTALRQFKKR